MTKKEELFKKLDELSKKFAPAEEPKKELDPVHRLVASLEEFVKEMKENNLWKDMTAVLSVTYKGEPAFDCVSGEAKEIVETLTRIAKCIK